MALAQALTLGRGHIIAASFFDLKVADAVVLWYRGHSASAGRDFGDVDGWAPRNSPQTSQGPPPSRDRDRLGAALSALAHQHLQR